MNPDGNLQFLKKERETHVAQSEAKVDPTKDLTFNLKLTDAEREAKEKVVLPYRHHMSKDAPTGGGTIILDDNDEDYDEEDPDEDLDM